MQNEDQNALSRVQAQVQLLESMLSDLKGSGTALVLAGQLRLALAEQAGDLPDPEKRDSILYPYAFKLGDVSIERTTTLKAPAMWAVRRLGDNLNIHGQWEFEPMPSNRDVDFWERCRFPDLHSAQSAAVAALEAETCERLSMKNRSVK